jgi:hypothetical protein
VKVCLSHSNTDPVIALRFFPPPDSTWVHIAEVTFYGNTGQCTTDFTTSLPITQSSCKS